MRKDNKDNNKLFNIQILRVWNEINSMLRSQNK